MKFLGFIEMWADGKYFLFELAMKENMNEKQGMRVKFLGHLNN